MDMFDNLQLSEMPERIELENGYYGVTIEEIKRGEPKQGEEDKYKLHFVIRMRVDEPESEKGIIHFERVWCGSDTDPLCEDKSRLRTNRGFKMLRSLAKAAMLPDSLNGAQFLEAIKGQKVCIKVRRNKGQAKDGQEAREFVNIDDYYSMTSPQAALIGSAIGGAIAAPSTAATNFVAPVVTATTIKCPICGEEVPRAEYGKHMLSHRQDSPAAVQ